MNVILNKEISWFYQIFLFFFNKMRYFKITIIFSLWPKNYDFLEKFVDCVDFLYIYRFYDYLVWFLISIV